MSETEKKYTGGQYLNDNPSWDVEDSAWKAGKIAALISAAGPAPARVCDIGCGAGGVILELKKFFPGASFDGFEVAPDAARFWPSPAPAGVSFRVGDALASGGTYDLVMLIDVIEHLENPFAFLSALRGKAARFVFHFPLDLSAVSVARETPLLHQRKKVGHINYFTRNLALELLKDCGYRVLDARYSGAYYSSPHCGWKARLAALPRRLASLVAGDLGVRLLGGETLFVLAAPDGKTGN